MKPEIKLYTTTFCTYCVKAKLILRRNDLTFTEIDVSDEDKRTELAAKSGRKTVPQIYIGDFHVGGSDDLESLEKSGELYKLTQT